MIPAPTAARLECRSYGAVAGGHALRNLYLRRDDGDTMKAVLTLIGLIALLAGLLFMGQGSGYIPWPAESFMISEVKWVYYGAAIAAVGLLLMIFARR